MSDFMVEHRIAMLENKDEFLRRFNGIAQETIDFFESCGVDLDGKTVLDIGSGDGAVDLGIALKAGAKVVGTDVTRTDHDALMAAVERHVYQPESKADVSVSFIVSESDAIALDTGSVDHAFSRDVFEHVWDPIRLLKEAHRVVRPGGTLFIQTWPMWKSEWGAHIFDEIGPWEHLTESADGLRVRLTSHPDVKMASYASCSRLELPELQRALLGAGFLPARVHLQTGSFSVPENLAHMDWRDLGISGIKVLSRRV